MKTTDKILIIDLEATCWNDRPPRGQESEIIEIGVCILDTKTGKISQNEGIFSKTSILKCESVLYRIDFHYAGNA